MIKLLKLITNKKKKKLKSKKYVKTDNKSVCQ